MIIFLIGSLFVGACIFGIFGQNSGNSWKIYVRICTIIATISALGTTIMAIMIFSSVALLLYTTEELREYFVSSARLKQKDRKLETIKDVTTELH